MPFKVIIPLLLSVLPLVWGFLDYTPYFWIGNAGFQPSFSFISPADSPSLMDKFTETFFKGERKENDAENRKKCEKSKNGTYFDYTDECLLFVPIEINFEAARNICQHLGGDIWIPNLNNRNIFAGLLMELPEVTEARNEDIWIGLTTDAGRIITLEGNNVTATYYGALSNINNGGISHGGCGILTFKKIGVPRIEFQCCTGGCVSDFICSL